MKDIPLIPRFKTGEWILLPTLLKENASGCQVTTEDFRTRVRYLLWSGLDQKAQGEINVMKGKLAKTDEFLADKLQAQFYLQEVKSTKPSKF